MLLEIAEQPQPAGWQPQATLVVGRKLERRMLKMGVDAMMNGVPEQLDVPVPVLGSVAVRPSLDAPQVKLKSSKACDGCVRADVEWAGTLDVGKGKRNKSLPWTADTVTTLAFVTTDRNGAQVVELRPQPDGPQGVRVDVPALPPLYDSVVNGAMSHELRRQLDEGALSEPLQVLSLPPESGVKVRDLAVKARRGVELDLAFVTLHSGTVASVPDPGDGWAAVIPADTLLGLVHANAVQQEMVKGYAAEPTSLTIEDGRFEMGLKLWKAAKKPKYREYIVRGTVALQQGRLQFAADSAQSVGGGFFGDPMGAFVNAKLLEAMNEGASVALPGRQTLKLGDQKLVVRMDRVVADDDMVLVYGSVRKPGNGERDR